MRCLRQPCGPVSGYIGAGRPAVIGNILRHGANLQQRRARQIFHGHDDMADVSGVLRDEAVIEIVHRGAELRRSGSRLRPFR